MFEESVPFTFKWYDAGGNPELGFAKKGAVEKDALILDDERVPLDIVVEALARHGRLLVAFRPDAEAPPKARRRLLSGLEAGRVAAMLRTWGQTPEQLQRLLAQRRSVAEVARRQAELVAEGKGDLFRAAPCPACRSVVELSGWPETPWTWCPWCHSLWHGEHVDDGARYDVCPECGFWDRVRDHALLNFYFVVAAAGYSTPQWRLCTACALARFPWQLIKNLPFLLGIPSALRLRRRALADRDPDLIDLSRANALAAKRRAAEALPLYDQLLRGRKDHPGLLLDRGLALFAVGELDDAAAAWKAGLSSCGNYMPALSGLLGIDRFDDAWRERYQHVVKQADGETPAEPAAEPEFLDDLA